MRRMYFLILVVLPVVFSSCIQTAPPDMVVQDCFYFIDIADSAVSCEIRYDRDFALYDDASKCRSRSTDTINSFGDSVPYGTMTIGYTLYDDVEIPEEVRVRLQRTNGDGDCTVYFVDEVSEQFKVALPGDSYTIVLNDSFPDWIRSNYDHKFVLTDDKEQVVMLPLRHTH